MADFGYVILDTNLPTFMTIQACRMRGVCTTASNVLVLAPELEATRQECSRKLSEWPAFDAYESEWPA